MMNSQTAQNGALAIISRVKEFLRQFWNSLLLKIVLVILLFTVVMLIMQTATPVRTTRDMIFAYKHSMLLSKAETIASSLNNNLVLSGEGAQEVVSVLGSSDVGQIVITDAEGIVLFNSGGNSPATETYALFPEIVSALKGNDAFRCIYNGNAFLSYGAIPIMVGNVITGCVYVADEDQEQAEILNQIQQNAFRMAIVAVLVSLFLVYLLRKTPRQRWFLNAGYALVIGGALGNLYDRLVYGYVIDFLDFYIGSHHYPAFNIADCGVCTGVAGRFPTAIDKRSAIEVVHHRS